jgi:hypothetical protein
MIKVSRLVRSLVLVSAALSLTQAQAAPPGEKAQDTGTTMGDAVTQPLADVNLKRRTVPPELAAILANPYALNGVRTCRQIIAEVRKMDAALGDDVDRIEVDPLTRKRRDGAAAVTRGVISSLIPFRSLIREVSGARAAEQDYREAIFAGVIRRGFLKGYGQARRCRAPGRPMNALESAGTAAQEALRNDDEK